jgi:hypothetical protein
MKSIGEVLKEKNLQLDTVNPVLQGGFTQVPNFILKDPNISVGAKVAYAMFLSYAWHNDSCFPGQDRLADDMGLTRPRVTQLIAELEAAGMVTIRCPYFQDNVHFNSLGFEHLRRKSWNRVLYQNPYIRGYIHGM